MRSLGQGGMVASPHYLATEAGVAVLRRGGSAMDAAIATNAVLAVVMPYVCGLGGDLFALVYDARDRSLSGLNGSGRAPAEATLERVREAAGSATMPTHGPLSITVPGCVEAWGRLHERFGRLPLADILTDAIHYAGDGFPISREFARSIGRSAAVFHPATPAAATFFPDGKAPVEGEIFHYTPLAQTLRTIVEKGPRAYYEGPLAEEIVRSVGAAGGLLTAQDLAEHHSDWVEPLSVQYRDLTVYELPPNSQGVVALTILATLEDLGPDRLSGDEEEYVHLVSESARLAYADRDAHLTDLLHMRINPADLLNPGYVQQRAGMIGHAVSGVAHAGEPGDTIYLCAADADGNLVSLIESNFMGIGSGVMAGETGIMMQNRGAWFSLDPEHINVIAPGKRTMHTLMPGMAFRDGRPWLVFGTMGGSMQAQIHAELITRLVDRGMDLDDALAAPRFDAVQGTDEGGRPRVVLEGRFSPEVLEGLRERGHGVETTAPLTSQMGHAHAIRVLPNGVYEGASDPRTDSLALGY